LPLRISKTGESFAVEDASCVALACVYFEEDPRRRGLNRHFSADAKVVTHTIARALMVAAKSITKILSKWRDDRFAAWGAPERGASHLIGVAHAEHRLHS
jgi:2C-methyl-D-erythritol 2,4-cyclodiphosphate synthase